MSGKGVVEVGTERQRELERLGSGLRHVFRAPQSGDFDDLLSAIDAAAAASAAKASGKV